MPPSYRESAPRPIGAALPRTTAAQALSCRSAEQDLTAMSATISKKKTEQRAERSAGADAADAHRQGGRHLAITEEPQLSMPGTMLTDAGRRQ
ncbi:MAG: hypothetical protein CMP81_15480 [Fulvimarina sp.]|nr:hypothetical protein [Fulvimarina sp.]